MKRFSALHSLVAAALVAVFGLAGASAAQAYSFTQPAGLACPLFEVEFTVENGALNLRTFYDRDGNPIRQMWAGKGSDLTIRNMYNGHSVSFKSGGLQETITFNADGTRSVYQTQGHQLLVLFPSDMPAGPSTRLIVGRVVLAVNADGWSRTVVSETGTTTDICAAIA
jgi:hypothetical protein